MTFAATIAVFGGLGYWLDTIADSSPWLLLAGVLIGMAGGMLHLLAALAPEMFKRGGEGDAGGGSTPSPTADSTEDSRGAPAPNDDDATGR